MVEAQLVAQVRDRCGGRISPEDSRRDVTRQSLGEEEHRDRHHPQHHDPGEQPAGDEPRQRH
jgi:hypothetical protein